jgi:hypothetical protein
VDLRDKEVQGSMNYKNPLVSIIILNYNGKKFLKNWFSSKLLTFLEFARQVVLSAHDFWCLSSAPQPVCVFSDRSLG